MRHLIKYADDTTIQVNVNKSSPDISQDTVNQYLEWSEDNWFCAMLQNVMSFVCGKDVKKTIVKQNWLLQWPSLWTYRMWNN